MESDQLFERYREFQEYVGWAEDDAARIAAVAPLIDQDLPGLIDDFYAQIERHPEASKVITGGQPQIERLKGTLLRWVRELLSGKYDDAYVERRRKVGERHVEIGLEQVYTNVALSRLRTGLSRSLQARWDGDACLFNETTRSLDKLLDLDLAIIEGAYQAEYSRRLQNTERLATLGQIAGGVAHELRNPLNVVKTSVYYLLNARNPTPEKKAEHLSRIERQVELADGVIKTLSDFARMPMPSLAPVPVEPCVFEALEAYPPSKSIRLLLEFPPSLRDALADADQLRIVFGNLIRNARDAMIHGGDLSISGSDIDDVVEVAVSDTGIGIPEADLSRILEPLYSTKSRGLGLGLAIVRTILDKSGGSLRVDSQLGKGSVFTVRLLAATTSSRGMSRV
ncbi:protoglobin domain-containing protein [Singulisphaera sp. PoT]|uniref:protoglobin domain-containing protein n=1 Tax=Singulisphaera sp. PoT TaxID=3411797 RepID=UPI003BF5A392